MNLGLIDNFRKFDKIILRLISSWCAVKYCIYDYVNYDEMDVMRIY